MFFAVDTTLVSATEIIPSYTRCSYNVMVRKRIVYNYFSLFLVSVLHPVLHPVEEGG